MEKQNCWDVKQCERGPGGAKVHEGGICAAAAEQRADGIHGGKNGGRCCWVIAGTLCKGPTVQQGSYMQKFCSDCQNCDFYSKVKKEEEPNFKVGMVIMKEIKSRGN